MMENKDFNFNYSECIKSYSKWGEEVYVNICKDNETTTVPWGLGGYGFIIFCTALGLILISITCLFIYCLINLIRD